MNTAGGDRINEMKATDASVAAYHCAQLVVDAASARSVKKSSSLRPCSGAVYLYLSAMFDILV